LAAEAGLDDARGVNVDADLAGEFGDDLDADAPV
jgi:hypothetical protein